jgi:diguanylate cyclase (GGDEF)-like protein
LRNGRLVGLMLLNVNKLREINDAFGIEGGDAVLAQAARHVRSSLHAADTVVRWSGDQFIVILEDLGAREDAQQAAEKILDRFAFPLALGEPERECAVSLSIGIAMFPAPSCDMDALLERAGLAMTHARNWGGNNAHTYAFDGVPAPSERLTLKNGLRDALALDQLLLEYRPQVDLASGQLAGVETLIRWAHPQYGRLEAARFMPLAEETRLAVPIGAWALRSACLQNVAWREAGLPPVRTAVKLSARQLAHPGMAESILATIRKTGIDPRCLQLEIDAGALADALSPQAIVLDMLRRAGVHVCIDGVGAENASLRRLAELPADLLKLDSSFIERLGQPVRDGRAWALAESIIHMAHRLQLTVIAEGVTTRAQLADLRQMGCDAAQGDVVQRPAGADEIAQLFKRPLITPPAACPTP